jgi:PAS domain S-box-containing protein
MTTDHDESSAEQDWILQGVPVSGDPELRRRAEEALQQRAPGSSPTDPEQIESVLHELRVHQIELEMQNEELLRTQLELEAAHARYFDLYDLAPVGYLTLDDQEEVLESNLEAARLLGVERRDLQGRPITDFVHPESQDALYHYWRAGPAGSDATLDLRLRSDDAVERWVRLTASAAVTRAEERVPRRVVLADVTERLRADRQLRSAQATAAELFERSPVALLDIDASQLIDRVGELFATPADAAQFLSGHGDEVWPLASLARVENANPSALELFGAPNVEELEELLFRSLSDESLDLLAAISARIAGGATTLRIPMTVRVRERDARNIDLIVVLLPGSSGRLDRAVASCVDVTGHHRLEADAQRLNRDLQRTITRTNEQLDATTRELEALVYSIAHDVRSPLRAIDGFTAGVMESEHSQLSEQGIEDLARVRAASQKLARLLDDLMDLSHLSRRDLRRRPVDIGELAREVHDEKAASHPARSVELVVSDDLWAHADPTALRVVLRELLGNAWKFTAPHDTALIEVGALQMGGETAFYVRDDGVGFDAQRAEHLFGAFQRMHHADAFEGDGIGLATVQRLVRRHGGRCWAEAEPENGATFFFTLPRGAETSGGVAPTGRS